ncbi:hypothetical protein M885DRAFT_550246 [Pelagophyceae sp. CCMP2097]|nr:hypothetical protein M885DRAFT_550246 [Pelagophyceae sp. CCMP2097]
MRLLWLCVLVPTAQSSLVDWLLRRKEEPLPPRLEPVASVDIRQFFANDDVPGLHHALDDFFWRTARRPGPLENALPLRPALISKGAGNTYSSAYKLDHDVEQLEYLSSRLNETDVPKAAFLRDVVLPRFRRVRARIPPLTELEKTGGLWGFRPNDAAEIGDFYNRALHLPDPEPVVDMLGKGFADPSALASEYASSSVLVVDDALSSEAFAQIRDLLLESTVFFETKMPLRFGAYVGAIVEDGLHARAFLKLADALKKQLPELLGGHELAYLWAYKYDADLAAGIKVHADEAAVNVNLWLTPDDANLESDSGGLVVYTARPENAATAEDYNARGEEYAATLLEKSKYANVTVPYKANRAVIFDSALFHKTASIRFKRGYANRRINLTLLFGTMQKGPTPAKAKDL